MVVQCMSLENYVSGLFGRSVLLEASRASHRSGNLVLLPCVFDAITACPKLIVRYMAGCHTRYHRQSINQYTGVARVHLNKLTHQTYVFHLVA